MELKFLGHACFILDDGTCKVLVDPFLTGNPLAPVSAETIEADYICVTHGHGDHLGDAVDIARRTGAPICCTVDLADSLPASAGVKTITGNMGGRIPLPFGSVKFLNAVHGSGASGTLASGFLFEMGNKTIYHAGDTALTADMALLAEEHVDAALLPIGDVYTMGPGDALRAAKMIQPQLVIPMHYNTMPPIVQDAAAFADTVEATGLKAAVLQPGESIIL